VTAAERVEAVLGRFHGSLRFDQAILIAAAEAEGIVLDPSKPADAGVILYAEASLDRGLTVHDAIGLALARAAGERAARTPYSRRATQTSRASLDDVLCDPRVAASLVSARSHARDHDGLVLLDQHDVGPHAIELWGAPAASGRPCVNGSPAGRLIGICLRCGAGVGDEDMTFGAWDGTSWRYSGFTLPGSLRLLAAEALLCHGCAVRAKCHLIVPPNPHALVD
jgi:hypothetical protein